MRLKAVLFWGSAFTAIAVIVFHGIYISRIFFSSHALPKKYVPVKGNVTHSLVCLESYTGPNQEIKTNWVTENCDYGVPIPELVTVVLFDSNHKMALDVQRSLPGVAVIVPVSEGDAHLSDSGSIKYVFTDNNANPGEIWNTLLSTSNTRYTFLAVNVLNFNLDLRALQRLVRVLSETVSTQVVGGAIRNITGHWRAGCYQMTLKNYILTFTKGYHESSEECMICDLVDTPFLAETRLLKKVPMDMKLPANMLLADFFLKIFESQKSLLCPDIMLDANDFLASAPAMDKHSWKALATTWELNRVHIRFPRSAILHKFNCSEVGLSCKSFIHSTLTKTLPVCCQEEFARLIDFWARFADEHGIVYQFLFGSLLGAVKMEDVIPWDIDGDLYFNRDNFSFVQESIGAFNKAGINLIVMREPSAGEKWKSWGYLKMVFSKFFIEMYAAPMRFLEKGGAINTGDNPSTTWVEIHGVWVAAPPNPGLYARGRYGEDILKHAISWRQTGKKNDAEPYDAGQFSVICDEDWHHACLDTMPADGSFAFNVPEY